MRPLIRDADLYHISARPDGIHWDGMEYFDEHKKRGVVYAFRGSTEKEGDHTFMLQDLNPGSRYQLRFHDHSAADRIAMGNDLTEDGLHVQLPIANSSELIFLDEVAR